MNLHGIVAGAISAVNPLISCSIERSVGYTTADDGTQVPAYAVGVQVQCQMQSLTYNDLQKMEGLNLQGNKRALYLNGTWDGVVRQTAKGGDLVILPDLTRWLVVQVLEDWPDWSKLAITQQL